MWSDVEWRKHLSAEGFVFPEERQRGYLLDFVAGPDEPAVEHDVRHFIDVIEDELTKCEGLISGCSFRWRNSALPGKISRQNIYGNGYRYGDYRFTLDQGQILELLMGENLYEDPYVFVRELIQNAIDTSRYRHYIEHTYGNTTFEPKLVQVSEWIDEDGYHWVRFDDYGMGMDEEIVKDHLLKVGSSYYKTAKFRADILRAQEKGSPDFVPISRFGIGLLSCFIVGDKVEISTRRAGFLGTEFQPVRLSISGLHGFYTLQTSMLRSAPMPGACGEDLGYPKEFGT